jgi:putative tricarboxylic transport membrane protein
VIRGLAGPAVLLVAAAVLWFEAARIPIVPVPGALGPEVWPRFALLGLAAASLVKIGQVVRAGRRPAGAAQPAGPGEEAPGEIDRGALLGAIALIAGFAAMAPVVGFPLANALLLASFMWVGGFRRPLAAGALALGITVILLYVFVKVVYLPLPRGEWAFHDLTLALYRALGII